MNLALVADGQFVRTIPNEGRIDVADGLQVSPPEAGWECDYKGVVYCILNFVPFVTPEGKVPDGGPSYDIVSGKVVETFVVVDRPPPPVPEQETLADWRVGLILMGRFNDVKASVEAARDTGDAAGLIAWERFEYANHTYRQELLTLMPAFGFSAEEVDESMWKARNVSQGVLQPGLAVRS